jgi:hypothetical protein
MSENLVRPAAFSIGAPVPECLASAFAAMAPRHLKEDFYDEGMKHATDHPDVFAVAWTRACRTLIDEHPDLRPDQAIGDSRFYQVLFVEFNDVLCGRVRRIIEGAA